MLEFLETNPLKNKSLGIALSGGGSRGAFHVGFLKAIEPVRDQVTFVSGTSIGAVIGAFYCANSSFEKMMDLFNQVSLFSLMSFGKNNAMGLMKLDGLRKILIDAGIPKSFDQLRIPLTVITTDINSNDYLAINSGNLHDAILASCSIPIIFKSVIIEGRECVDGGLLNNLPANVLEDKVDTIIGVHINNYKVPERSDSIKMQADKLFSLVIRQNVLKYSKYCHYYVNPELDHVSVLDFQHINTFYKTGLSIGEEFLNNPEKFANRKDHWLHKLKKAFL